jgi:hypothetical protein
MMEENMNKRYFVITITVLMLFVSVFSVSAKTSQTAFLGTCAFLDEPEQPDNYREWYTDGNLWHQRNGSQVMYCEFSDDRLPNYVWLDVNWDVRFLESFPFLVGHDYGGLKLKDGYDGEVLWEGNYNGFFNEDGYSERLVILKGVGVNSGLKIKATANTDFTFSIVQFPGVLIDPGK